MQKRTTSSIQREESIEETKALIRKLFTHLVDNKIDTSNLNFQDTYSPYGDTSVVSSSDPTDDSLTSESERVVDEILNPKNGNYSDLQEFLYENADLFSVIVKEIVS